MATKKRVGHPKLSWGITRLRDWFCQHAPVAVPDMNLELTRPMECCAFVGIGHVGEIRELPDRLDLDQKAAAFAIALLEHTYGPWFLATTNQTQRTENQVLRTLGFHSLTRVHNSNSGNQVTLWIARRPTAR